MARFPLPRTETTAARAGRAAAAQGRFWAFHDALYANQTPVNSDLNKVPQTDT